MKRGIVPCYSCHDTNDFLKPKHFVDEIRTTWVLDLTLTRIFENSNYNPHSSDFQVNKYVYLISETIRKYECEIITGLVIALIVVIYKYIHVRRKLKLIDTENYKLYLNEKEKSKLRTPSPKRSILRRFIAQPYTPNLQSDQLSPILLSSSPRDFVHPNYNQKSKFCTLNDDKSQHSQCRKFTPKHAKNVPKLASQLFTSDSDDEENVIEKKTIVRKVKSKLRSPPPKISPQYALNDLEIETNSEISSSEPKTSPTEEDQQIQAIIYRSSEPIKKTRIDSRNNISVTHHRLSDSDASPNSMALNAENTPPVGFNGPYIQRSQSRGLGVRSPIGISPNLVDPMNSSFGEMSVNVSLQQSITSPIKAAVAPYPRSPPPKNLFTSRYILPTTPPSDNQIIVKRPSR